MSTYDDASLIYYPSGVKSGKAYSLKPTDGSGDLTFTRASTATRVNESGLIESVATGVPRIDYTSGCGKLLLEPQRTNSILYSQEIDNAYWTKVNLAVSANVISSLDPSGLNTAELITATSGVSQSEVSRSVTTINATPYVFSFFGKKGSGATDLNSFRVLGSGVLNTVTINWDTGAITQSGSGATSVNMGNGWFRIIIPFTANSVTTVLQLVSFQVYPLNVSSLRWGAQLEAGSYPTSPIITTTTAVTRVADSASKSGISSLINSEEGVLYWQGSSLSNDLTYKRISIGTSDNLFVNNVGLRFDNTGTSVTYQFRVGNVYQAELSSTINQTSVNKIACIWKVNRFELWLNGVKVAEDTSGSVPSANTLNSVFYGKTSTTLDEALYGNTQSFMIFPSALSDAELIALTTL